MTIVTSKILLAYDEKLFTIKHNRDNSALKKGKKKIIIKIVKNANVLVNEVSTL